MKIGDWETGRQVDWGHLLYASYERILSKRQLGTLKVHNKV